MDYQIISKPVGGLPRPIGRVFFMQPIVKIFCLLVNNAGVGCVAPLECMTMEHIKQMFDVNFFGSVRLIQAVLPGMKARQDGYIVNVSSIFGITGGPFNDMYSAAKFAMGGLTESLAPVLKQFNIR